MCGWQPIDLRSFENTHEETAIKSKNKGQWLSEERRSTYLEL